ncbi:MAG: hypothetical protein ACRD4B_07305, partial [Acidobacteriota bacterium]
MKIFRQLLVVSIAVGLVAVLAAPADAFDLNAFRQRQDEKISHILQQHDEQVEEILAETTNTD